jgi:hypothetical protein
MWAYTGTKESQNACPGDFRTDLPGLEIGGLDRIDRSRTGGLDGLFLVDAQGHELYKEHRTVPGWSTAATVVHNFDGKGSDYMIAYHRGGGLPPGLYDGYMHCIATFPIDGQFMWGDLLGNGSTQIVAYDNEKACIFSSVRFDPKQPGTGKPLPQPKRLYNWTRYFGSETTPEPKSPAK